MGGRSQRLHTDPSMNLWESLKHWIPIITDEYVWGWGPAWLLGIPVMVILLLGTGIGEGTPQPGGEQEDEGESGHEAILVLPRGQVQRAPRETGFSARTRFPVPVAMALFRAGTRLQSCQS